MCEVDQVQVVNSVTTMLLMMQEGDQPQVVISKTVHYAINKMGVCVTTIKPDVREPRDFYQA